MGIKDFVTKKAMDWKMKDLPEEQKQMVMAMYEKNPELMETIAKEIQHKVKNEGKSEMAASMEVMRKHQSELQKLAMGMKK
jgi:anthranilate phosphoribosyltransferase